MTMEQALATLTHRCRFRPGLKLRSDACEVRLGRNKSANGKTVPVYWECAQCGGPVPRDPDEAFAPSGEKPDSAAGPPASRTERNRAESTRDRKPGNPKSRRNGRELPIGGDESPRRCYLCGKGPEETKVYPSQKTRCIECIVRRKQELSGKSVNEKEEETLSVKAVKNDPDATDAWPDVIAAPDPGQTDQVREEPAHPYICEIHGPHSGRMFGRAHSKICSKCHTEKMNARMKASAEAVMAPDLNSMTVPQWVADWCAEQAVLHQVSPREYLIDQIAREIPSDWLKDWMIRSAARIEAARRR